MLEKAHPDTPQDEPRRSTFTPPPAGTVYSGLTEKEAADKLAEVGPNRLPEPELAGPFVLFLRQFLSPFIYILLIAAIVSLAVNQIPSAVFIIAVLLINATIGTIQEASAEKSAAALRNMVRGKARVVRDGIAETVDAENIVPGDLVLLASGDKIPADLQLMDTDDLAVDESMLTGESLEVIKNAHAQVAADAPLGDRLNSAFAGSIVTKGRARGIVTATALHTAIGDIARHVAQKRVSEPPLMIRIRRFTYQVAGAIILAILALVAMMLWRGGYEATSMVMMGIGLAVSTIPEGLPAALTVALAIGMRRMAANNVIIRKLVAVEALGSCTFICSDKTGTLTVNKLTIDSMHLPDGSVIKASGAGIAPGEIVDSIDEPTRARLRELCETGILANESQLDYAGTTWRADGDIVDIAFLVFAKKYGMSLRNVREEKSRRHLIPYESEKAFSGSVNTDQDGLTLFVKGSPEKILAASTCMLGPDGPEPIDQEKLSAQFDELARQGYRVIALGKRSGLDTDKEGKPDFHGEELCDLTFLGLAAMIDPVRPEAREAIEKCRAGGIEVAMVTGDHPATARAIGADLGLCDPDAQVVTGAMIREAEGKGPKTLRDLILPARVFARIEPIQKQTIVGTFMQAGHFVAVTGDGVNDAPAMRRANAGVAMGQSGTDVAKEAADLIITDDNFASIVAGIEQGRIVYNNIRKVIGLLTATGFSALLLFFLTVIAGLPMPMTAVQLLWLNLVANGLQDVALAFEPKEGGELSKPPRNPREPIFERHIIEHVLVAGSVMGGLAFFVFSTALQNGMGEEMARNVTLMTMVLFGNVHALSSRSETKSIFRIPYFANLFLAIATPAALGIHLLSLFTPGVSHVLQLSPIPIFTFINLVAIALIFLAVEELHKMLLRARAQRESHRPMSDHHHGVGATMNPQDQRHGR